MHEARVWVLAALLLAAAAGVARAGDNKDVARDAYRDGTRLYDLADYRGALEQFKKAYFNYEEPAFLFNIAQCYRQLNQKGDAIRFYKTFLRKLPDAPNAEETRRMIAQLEAAQAAEKPSGAPPPAATRPSLAPAALTLTATPPRDRRPAYKKWWVWTLVGVGVAAAATAVAVGVTEGGRTETTFSPVRAQ